MTMFPIDAAFFTGRSPGCYNDPDFRRIEAKDPQGALQSYARFVVQREMSEVEMQRVRAAVHHTVTTLLARASPAEMMSSCYFASMACLQILEAANIWGVVLSGSIRIQFPSESEIEDRFFGVTTPPRPEGRPDMHGW